jgi:quercetin dioxygenase-like cupin family protein
MNQTARLTAASILVLTAFSTALAQEHSKAAGVTWDELARTTTNAVGDTITYPTGTSELYVEIGTFEKEGQTSLHQHPVPIVVYVMEGELEVRVDGADPIRMKRGQAFVEPQNRNMQAFNVADGPTKVLVVTIGAEGQPTAADPQ